MEETLIQELLTGNGTEINELREKSGVLVGFLELAKKLDALPKMEKRFYENNRSLYQVTSMGREIIEIENILKAFFGPPVKHAGNPLPVTLKLNASVKHLNGIKKNQTLFLLQLKHGEFYGALWPWTKDPNKIEVHLGYCAEKMQRDDYVSLESLVKKSLSHKAFNMMDTSIGGQIHGIGLPAFLQMSEMEGVSLTLKVTAHKRQGLLYLSEGSLVAAETSGAKGREAAYRIISWDNPVIQIEPSDDEKTDEIQLPLMHLLMESLKIKDENEHGNAGAMPAPEMSDAEDTVPEPPPLFPPADEPEAPSGEPEISEAKPPKPPKPEKKVRPKRRPFPWLIALLVIVIIGVLGTGGLHYYNMLKITRAYDAVIANVTAAKELARKAALLTDYLEHNGQNKFTPDVERRLKEILEAMAAAAYKKLQQQVAGLVLDTQYEENASQLYDDFLVEFPNGELSATVRKSRENIRETMDRAYYEKVTAAKRLKFSQRFETYHGYLTLLPDGRHREEVSQLISKMGDEYYAYIQSELPACRKERTWDACIQLCDNFIAVFHNNPKLSEVEKHKAVLTDEKNFDLLQEKVRSAGADPEIRKKLYSDYLKSNPGASHRMTVQEQLGRIDEELKLRRTWDAVRKYAVNRGKSISARIGKLEEFLIDHPDTPYSAEAEKLVSTLRKERKKALLAKQQETLRQQELAQRERAAALAMQEAQRVERLRSMMTDQLKPVSQRYQAIADGVVKDLRTGLEWALLDSQQQTGRCMDYPAAQAFVREIDSGGHRDWRLPTSSELAVLYKSDTPFPDAGAPWYWTSEAFEKGYHRVVNIVTAEPARVYQRAFVSEDQCGAVRVVRP